MNVKGINQIILRTENIRECTELVQRIHGFQLISAEQDHSVFALIDGSRIVFSQSAKDTVCLVYETEGFSDAKHTLESANFRCDADSCKDQLRVMHPSTGVFCLRLETFIDAFEKILFYSPHEENGYLGNWFEIPLCLKGVIWSTSEHYYQAQKFVGTPYEEICRRTGSPREAFELTRRPDVPVDPNWINIREQVMYDAVYAKFTQNPEYGEKLCATGQHELVENSPVDYFWGIGADGSGKNVLGQILMRVREEIR